MKRQPAGVPTGGQFATDARSEAEVTVPDHLPEPLDNARMSSMNIPLEGITYGYERGKYTADLPYQRGSVWDIEQKRAFLRSLLRGLPVPAVIVNDRLSVSEDPGSDFADVSGKGLYAIIDGRQRVEAMTDFAHGRLSVPGHWFADRDLAEGVSRSEDVTFEQLSQGGQRRFENVSVPVVKARIPTLRGEAEMFVAIASTGERLTDEDIDRARSVASGDVSA